MSLKSTALVLLTSLLATAITATIATVAQAESSATKANAEKPTPSLYEKALNENAITLEKAQNTKAKTATTAALNEAPEGVLRLKDSYENKTLRTWKWVAGVDVQRFGAEGSYTNPLGTSGDLGQANKVLMPTLNLGMTSKPAQHELAYQGVLRAGFARQNLNLQTAYGTSEVGLNSVMLATQGQVGYQVRATTLSGVAELGRLSYSQAALSSGSSAKTNLNRSLDYFGYGFSLQQQLVESVRGELCWLQRQNMSESESRIQNSSFEAGLSVLW